MSDKTNKRSQSQNRSSDQGQGQGENRQRQGGTQEVQQRQGGMRSQGEGGGMQRMQQQGQGMQQRPGSLARQWQGRPLQGQSGWTSPFALMRSLVQDMDRFVDDVWFNRPLVPLIEQDLDQGFGQGLGQGFGQGLWQPEIELRMQEGNMLVTADLPGMNREDVNLEVRDGNLIIEGERQQSSEQEQQGFYSSERRYGAFMRVIPLPEGADAAQAKARFENGVLEVRVPVEEESQQGHRIEVE